MKRALPNATMIPNAALRRFGLPLMALCAWPAPCLLAQGASRRAASTDTVQTPSVASYPDLAEGRELTLTALGAGLAGAGALFQGHDRYVPSSGLDPSEIAWAIDRRTVDNYSPAAATASDWTQYASIAFPFVLGLATGPPGEGWRSFGRLSVVYGETFLISEGLAFLGKTTFDRPRPYLYRPASERPGGSSDGLVSPGAFQSMPSGHSTAAWTGVTMGVTEDLLRRPSAGWAERAGIGLLGGALAGATSTLRVTAGQHFPSDVIAGAGIGIVTGVTIPLLHRGDRPMPPLRSWLEATGGVVAGAAIGVAMAR